MKGHLHKILWIYVGIAFLFLLYEQPWNKAAWTTTDGVDNRMTALIYVIFWPYALFLQGSKTSA